MKLNISVNIPDTTIYSQREIELAWAAGFFDGEGGTYTHLIKPKYKDRYYPSILFYMKISQTSNNGIPEVLLRFQKAVNDKGIIRGPYEPQKKHWAKDYEWHTNGHDVCEVIVLLWSYLSPVKQKQIVNALTKTQKYNIPLPAVEGWNKWRLRYYPFDPINGRTI